MNSHAANLDAADTVVQVIVGTADWGRTNLADLGGTWVDVTEQTGYPGPGWTWDGATFVPPFAPEPDPDA